MRVVIAFLKLSRLHFLLLPTLPYALGLVLAAREGAALNGRLAALGFLVQLLVQLSTAYINDYFDLPTDRLNTRRTLLSGGSGELANGALPPRVAVIAAGLCQSGALLLALAADLPPVSWPLLLLALGAARFYTAPPLCLAWRGWGELAAAATAALLVPAWAYSLQTGTIRPILLTSGLPLLPFIAGMLLAIATPDVPADAQVGKRTLAVRVGEGRVHRLYAALALAGYALALLLWPHQAHLPALATLPLAVAAWTGLRAPGHLNRPGLLAMIIRAAVVPGLLLAVLLIMLARV